MLVRAAAVVLPRRRRGLSWWGFVRARGARQVVDEMGARSFLLFCLLPLVLLCDRRVTCRCILISSFMQLPVCLHHSVISSFVICSTRGLCTGSFFPWNRGLGWLIDQFNPERNTTAAMVDPVSTFADDRALAEDMQVQEVLQFSTQSERACAVCKQVFLSLEASWKPDDCDHAICIACFCQHAPETGASGLPRCAVPSCESSRMSEAQQRMEMDVFHDALTSFEDMDAGKGKESWDGNGMLQEDMVAGGIDFYCTICLESVHVRELFPIAGCRHTFCVGCVSQYIAAKVEENVLSIGCPDPGCKDGTLHPEECRDVIPLKVFQRWGAALRDSALGALKFYCPFRDCSALLVDDHGHGEVAITEAKCPHCSRLFCAQCKVAWHDGVTCAEFQRLGNDERGKDDLLLRKVAKNKNWQRCPMCKMYVERVDGCVYIVCRCRHCFCYLCGSPMTKGDHRCSKCQRTW